MSSVQHATTLMEAFRDMEGDLDAATYKALVSPLEALCAGVFSQSEEEQSKANYDAFLMLYLQNRNRIRVTSEDVRVFTERLRNGQVLARVPSNIIIQDDLDEDEWHDEAFEPEPAPRPTRRVGARAGDPVLDNIAQHIFAPPPAPRQETVDRTADGLLRAIRTNGPF